MKTISLKQLRLLNFKGTRNYTIDFPDSTSIFGDNGTGKSTLFDAFTWVLFGKDSHDRKDYGVKTYDKDHNEIPKIDHEVTAVLEVEEDGKTETITLKRTLKENWVKKRGTAIPEFTGNVTEFHWNDVPMQAKEYQAKIAGIMDEQVFKLITNPLAFNSLKWQDQRAVLMALCDEVDDTVLLDKLATIHNKEAVANLTNLLNSNKSIDEIKRETAAKRKKINEELKTIPTRIDEVTRNTPAALDFAGIRKDIEAKQAEIKTIEDQIADKSKALEGELQKRTDVQVKIHDLKTQLTSLSRGAAQKAKDALTIDYSTLRELERNRDAKIGYLAQYEREVATIEAKIESLNMEIQSKREAWTRENARELTFGDADFHCPTCKREFEEGDVDAKKAEMLENFKADKARKLQTINAEGKALSVTLSENKERLTIGCRAIVDIEAEIADLTNKVTTEQARIDALKTGETEESLTAKYFEETNYKELAKELKALETQLGEAPKVDTAELQDRKTAIQVDIDHLKTQLSQEERIKDCQKRIAQLEEEEQKLSDAHIQLEGQEFAIENFIKLQIETLEQRINSQFSYVKFKLFNTQINGGIVECCEALINGVPFSGANTASRINAGVDIINTLSSYYQVTAPIFIDNRESVVELIPCRSQIINLIVSKKDKALRVEAVELEKEVA